MKCIECEKEIEAPNENFCSYECYEQRVIKIRTKFAELSKEIEKQIEEMNKRSFFWDFFVPVIIVFGSICLIWYSGFIYKNGAP